MYVNCNFDPVFASLMYDYITYVTYVIAVTIIFFF